MTVLMDVFLWFLNVLTNQTISGTSESQFFSPNTSNSTAAWGNRTRWPHSSRGWTLGVVAIEKKKKDFNCKGLL